MNEIAQNPGGEVLASQEAPRPQRPPKPPQIKMDRSRQFAEVHGIRGPNDPYYGVHFIQEGLLYTAEGTLILDHPVYSEETTDGDKRRQALERKLRKHNKDAANRTALEVKSDGDLEDVDPDEEEDEEEDELEPVNLTEWAAGRQQVEWNDVTQAIAHRYKKRVASIADAIPFLVKEGVIQPGMVAKKYRKYLD